MNTVEQRFENGEYFLPKLVLSGGMVRQITEIIKLGNNLKIMVGGRQISDTIGAYTGADAFGRDAVAAVRLVWSWTKKG